MNRAADTFPVDVLTKPLQADSEAMTAADGFVICRTFAEFHSPAYRTIARLVPHEMHDDLGCLFFFRQSVFSPTTPQLAGRASPEHDHDNPSDDAADTVSARWKHCLGEIGNDVDDADNPILMALRTTINRNHLDIALFYRIIEAAERQPRSEYRFQTWNELITHCRRDAGSFARLIYRVISCGNDFSSGASTANDNSPSHETTEQIEQIAMALQLTAYWRNLKKNLLERDLLYIPQEFIDAPDFEERCRRSARQGYGVDRDFLEQSRRIIRRCVEHTWPLYEGGKQYLASNHPIACPIAWLILHRGAHLLRKIELWNYETALHRPSLNRWTEWRLRMQARLLAYRLRRKSAGVANKR